MFEPRKNHPFLEIIFERDCHDIFLQIGFRDLFASGIAFNKMTQGEHVCLGMIPDPSAFNVKMSPDSESQYIEHLTGSVLNQFIKRVLCREHMATFDALQLFKGKQNPKLNPKALEILVQLFLSGFPMLSAKMRTEDNLITILFHSRGSWTTRTGYALPQLSPRATDFKINEIENEFELLRFQADSNHDLANHAMKAKILSAISSLIYGMHYSASVPDKEIEDNNKIVVTENKVLQSNKLTYMLEKVRRNA